VALDGDVDWGKLLFSLGLVDGDRPLGFMGTAWIEILELEAFLQGGAWLSGAEMCMLDPDFLRAACARFRSRKVEVVAKKLKVLSLFQLTATPTATQPRPRVPSPFEFLRFAVL